VTNNKINNRAMWLSDEMKTNYTHTLTAKLTNFFLLSLFNVVLEVLGHDNFYFFFKMKLFLKPQT